MFTGFQIKVEVVKNVVVQISDLPLSDGVYHAELITSTSVSGMDATDLTTELQAVAEVYENGEKIEDPAVAWTSSDKTVVKCEDGKLTAQGFGNGGLACHVRKPGRPVFPIQRQIHVVPSHTQNKAARKNQILHTDRQTDLRHTEIHA